MKIALAVHCFFPTHFYGTEAYTLTLAKALKTLGHEPVVVSAVFQGETPQDAPVVRYDWDGIPVVSIDKNATPHSSVAETYAQPAMRAVHRAVLQEIKPDILHVCHLINHTTALIDAAGEMDIPIFATLTDFFGFCLTNKLEAADGSLCTGPSASRGNCIACHLKAAAGNAGAGRKSRLLGHPAVRWAAAPALAMAARLRPATRVGALTPADIVRRPAVLQGALSKYRAAIAPSTFLMEAYRANGFPAPLKLSHFGIDIARDPKPVASPDGRVRVGAIGQLASHKGIHLLLEAMRMARAPNLALTLWGDEKQDPTYAARLRALAEGLDITFAGTVPASELATALASIDMLAIPSVWYENSPLILLQALATHTPVIVSDVAGLTEFMVEGQSGFAFPRGDAAGLAGVLKRLAADPTLPRRMAAATAYERSTLDMARDVAALYAEHGFA